MDEEFSSAITEIIPFIYIIENSYDISQLLFLSLCFEQINAALLSLTYFFQKCLQFFQPQSFEYQY